MKRSSVHTNVHVNGPSSGDDPPALSHWCPAGPGSCSASSRVHRLRLAALFCRVGQQQLGSGPTGSLSTQVGTERAWGTNAAGNPLEFVSVTPTAAVAPTTSFFETLIAIHQKSASHLSPLDQISDQLDASG